MAKKTTPAPKGPKQATAPKQRQNMTMIRAVPMKRMQANIKGPKPDKPSVKGIF